jgi:hypothetical protein
MVRGRARNVANAENKSPAMPWYPRDFAADEPVQLMTLVEECAYRRLLDHQWLHGSVPADVTQLARICKNVAPAKMKKLWTVIAPLFPEVSEGAGRLRNRKLERVRAGRQAYIEKQSASGKAGAQARWKDKYRDGEPNGDSIATPLANESLASASASAVASAVAGTSSHPQGDRFADLLNRLPATGQAKGTITEFLAALPDAKAHAWTSAMLGYLDGVDMPAGVRPTPAHLVTACRDYMANAPTEPNMAHFRSFISRVVRDENRQARRSRPAATQPVADGPDAGAIFDKILTMGESLPGGISFSLQAIDQQFGPAAKLAVKDIGGSNALANMRGPDQRFLRDRFAKAYAAHEAVAVGHGRDIVHTDSNSVRRADASGAIAQAQRV